MCVPEVCVCVFSCLFEVCVFRNLHQLDLLLLSLDHERLLDVLGGAAVQRNRHHLSNNQTKRDESESCVAEEVTGKTGSRTACFHL